MDPRHYIAEDYLRDGNALQIRAIRPEDRDALRDGFHRLSGHSIYFRFHEPKQDLTDRELTYFTDIDFSHHVALVACLRENDSDVDVAVGRYIELEPGEGDTQRCAEIAFAVLDAYQNRGIATVLLKHLAHIAREQGIARFSATVLADNRLMLDVFEHSGYELERHTRSGMVYIEFPIISGAAEEPPP